MQVLDLLNLNYKKELPFVVYRKPNSENICGFFCENDSLIFTDTFKESGFVFAPFNNESKTILFSHKNSTFVEEEIVELSINENKNEHFKSEFGKDFHIELVNKAVKTIMNSDLQKVVISRKEEVLLAEFNFLNTFKKLLNNYPNAMVYVWFHPKIGLWLGATPETLLTLEDSIFTTMSLAGTQLFKGDLNVVWKNKEIEEQQLVSDFIEHQISSLSENFTIEKAKSIRAGSLLHLKSRVEGSLKSNSTLKELIMALHPTPAVCGLPRDMARDFIVNNENYKRDFYTGFLGEINRQTNNKLKSNLFVNLRCMNIIANKANIYVGGGITKDSIAEHEWQETVAKTTTMKSVL